ncbi:MAG: hypothetical protein REI64_17115 [Pedobacter sp.]|uniref:hypothetical protein n=1 Tax=Pedobacter sp. TaxID=1411316 RepID=UPI0028079C47|nr:hypothetical protein [Pedobacter sp.]MDQ8006526.1 hypothetical protein [Pedobacter sp.]
MSELLKTVFFSLTSIVTPLAMFIATCIYISKKIKTDSILLFLGALVGLIVSTVSLVIIPYFMRSGSYSSLEIQQIYMAIGIVSFFGGICFVIGFFILIMDATKGKRANQNDFPDSNIL